MSTQTCSLNGPCALVTTGTMILVSLLASPARAMQQHPGMPPGMTHEEHMKQLEKEAELKKRGAAAMGFDQGQATHHFRLAADGGAIEVTVNDPSDAAMLAAVRTHLQSIAQEFANGRFDKPFATHAEVPPGVPALEARKHEIRYRYEDLPAGGRVVIATADPVALLAVHEFLRYQIREHATGDPLTVTRP